MDGKAEVVGEVSAEDIIGKLEDMLAELGKEQFAFVATYMFSKEFRMKVFEDEKLCAMFNPDDVLKGEINVSFGDPETAKLIWKKILSPAKQNILSQLSREYVKTVEDD